MSEEHNNDWQKILNEETAIFYAVRAGDIQARGRVEVIWSGLVTSIAKQHLNLIDLPLEILVAAGMEGLLACIRRSPDKDHFFAHYTWWIKQAILEEIEKAE